MLLKDLTWPEVKSLDFDKLIVIFPTGSFEQHGPHLPFTTDTDIVSAIAERVERAMTDRVLLVPTLWPGLSTHHMHFPGTMDVPQMVYIQLITELGKSMASMGAKKVFILNGHGGNDTPIRAALRELKTAVPQTRFVFASYWTLAAKTLRRSPRIGAGRNGPRLRDGDIDHAAPASGARENRPRRARWSAAHRPVSQGRHAARPAGLFRQRVSRSHKQRRDGAPGLGLGGKGKTLSRRHRGGSFGVRGALFDVGNAT